VGPHNLDLVASTLCWYSDTFHRKKGYGLKVPFIVTSKHIKECPDPPVSLAGVSDHLLSSKLICSSIFRDHSYL
jgi:hypothetical protein